MVGKLSGMRDAGLGLGGGWLLMGGGFWWLGEGEGDWACSFAAAVGD